MVYSDCKAGISGAVHFGIDNRYQKSVFIYTNFKNGLSFENDNFSSEKKCLDKLSTHATATLHFDTNETSS
jgi:hypothetical protein